MSFFNTTKENFKNPIKKHYVEGIKAHGEQMGFNCTLWIITHFNENFASVHS